METITEVKLEISVPQEYLLTIPNELAKIGVGVIGNYGHCIAISPVQGYFCPLEGANPFDGETVKYKLGVNCKREL